MGPGLNHDELRELLGAYAIGALDDDERAQVERFLLEDAGARTELHHLQLGVAWLDHAHVRAPDGVWARIQDQLDEPLAPNVARLPVRRRSLVGIAAALVVALVVGIGVVVGTGSSSDPSPEAAARTLQAEPGTRSVALRDPEGRRIASAVLGRDGRAYLLPRDLDPLPDDRTYQVWAIDASGPESAGLLGARPAVRSLQVGRHTTALAITVEARGGSPTPTGRPVGQATLT